jgi:hypothetical protein
LIAAGLLDSKKTPTFAAIFFIIIVELCLDQATRISYAP